MSLDPLVEEPDAGSEIFPYSTNESEQDSPSSATASSGAPVNPDVDDDFTSDLWTDFGSGFGVDIALEELAFDSDTNNVQNRSQRDLLGVSVSNSKWIMRFTWRLDTKVFATTNTVSVNVLLNQIASGDLTGTDYITIRFLVGLTDGASAIQLRYGDIAGIQAGITSATFARKPLIETLYIEIKRLTTGIIEASLYSDATYETLIETINGGVSGATTGLRYAQVMGNTVNDATGKMVGAIKDFKFWNSISDFAELANKARDGDVNTFWESLSELNPFLYGTFSGIADKEPSQIALYVDKSKLNVKQFLIQTSPDAVVWTLKRTVNIDQLVDLEYNFIRFNRDVQPIRYIRIIGNDSTNKVLSISELKALMPDVVEWADRQAHKTISTTGIVGLSG